ncbi:MAG: hypothetical protein QOI55_853 [Actinomycetota bacterium]|nr:hypothetical protein [Actinomycetota bacterium]
MASRGEAFPGPNGVARLRYLRRLLHEPHRTLDELCERFGPVVGLGVGPMRIAIVGDPALLRELFAMPTESFRWGHRYNVLGFVVGDGSMLVSDGADHRRRRLPVQGAFARRRLNAWIPMIVERTDAAIDGLCASLEQGSDRVVDLYPIGRALVLDIVVRALFGERLAARAEEIGELFQRPQAYLESPGLRQLPHPFPYTARARVRADRRALDAILDEEIAHRRGALGDGADVLDALVRDDTLSDAEIRDQIVTLVGAGYDTTAASLAWMIIRASHDADVWASLRSEADEVLGVGAAPDHVSLARLVVADRVMRETLRLHPAGAISPRQVAVDISLGNRLMRKGTMLIWSAHLAGRDARTWGDPLCFRPERFADPTPEQKAIADQAWVPFGRGARNCIGFALAQMELTLMISRFAQRLDVSPTIDGIPHPKGMVVNRPVGGVPSRVAARR